MSDRKHTEQEHLNDSVETDAQDDLKKEIDTEDVAELEQRLEEVEEHNLRLQAEIQNMHKRHQRDREQWAKYRSQDLGKAILPVIDNLERALTIEPADDSARSIHEGVEMVLNSFEQALKSVGIEKIDCEGQPFDPNFHEAYTQLPAEDGQEGGMVVQVFENGYILKDRVLRAAKVAVSQ